MRVWRILLLISLLFLLFGVATANDHGCTRDDMYSIMLLHFNGDDGDAAAADFVDCGGRMIPSVGTGAPNNQLETSDKKFGTASWYINEVSAGYGLTYSNNVTKDFTFGTGPYTIDWWQKFPLNSYASEVVYANFNLRCYFNTDYDNCYFTPAASDIADFYGNDGQWHHYAIVRMSTSTNMVAFYRDGSLIGNKTDNTNYAGSITSWPMANTYSSMSNNYIDEYRVSNITRWSGTFTPQTYEYGGSPPETAPVAAFSCSPLVMVKGCVTACTNTDTNTPTSWRWYSPNYPPMSNHTTSSSWLNFTSGGYWDICHIAANGAGTDTECKSRYIYVKKPSAGGFSYSLVIDPWKSFFEDIYYYFAGYPPIPTEG